MYPSNLTIGTIARPRSSSTLQGLVSIVDSARQIRRKDRVPLAINEWLERVSSPPVGPSTPPGKHGPGGFIFKPCQFPYKRTPLLVQGVVF